MFWTLFPKVFNFSRNYLIKFSLIQRSSIITESGFHPSPQEADTVLQEIQNLSLEKFIISSILKTGALLPSVFTKDKTNAEKDDLKL